MPGSRGGINSFLTTVSGQGGLSMSNNFVVRFDDFPSNLEFEEKTEFDQRVEYFCDEAQLPNVNTATGSQVGLYLGMGQVEYPHTRVFTDLQLGFMLDSNMSILKFLNRWHAYIFGETPAEDGSPLLENRINRVKYRDEYACNIYITKCEIGPSSTIQRQPITYVIEKAYPYSIDAVPLQFGSSQVTKATAQFKYQRHYVIERDITNVKDSLIPAGGVLVGETEIRPGVFQQQYLLPNGKIIEIEGNKRAVGTQPSSPRN